MPLPLPLPHHRPHDLSESAVLSDACTRAASAAFLPTAKRLLTLASMPLERASAASARETADVPMLPPAAVSLVAPPGCERLIWPVARRVSLAAARAGARTDGAALGEGAGGGRPLVVIDPSRVLWEGLRRLAGAWTVRRTDRATGPGGDTSLGGRVTWWMPADAALHEDMPVTS